MSEIHTNEDPCDNIEANDLEKWTKCKDSDATDTVKTKQDQPKLITLPWIRI